MLNLIFSLRLKYMDIRGHFSVLFELIITLKFDIVIRENDLNYVINTYNFIFHFSLHFVTRIIYLCLVPSRSERKRIFINIKLH